MTTGARERLGLEHRAWTLLPGSIIASSDSQPLPEAATRPPPPDRVPGTTAPQGPWYQDGVPTLPDSRPISLPPLNTPAPQVRLFLCLAS